VGNWLRESLLWANDRRDLGASVRYDRDPTGSKAASSLGEAPGGTACLPAPSRFTSRKGFPFVIHAATAVFCADDDRPMGGFDSDIEALAESWNSRGLMTRVDSFSPARAAYGKRLRSNSYPGSLSGRPRPTTDPGTRYGQAKRASEFCARVRQTVWVCGTRLRTLFAS